MSIHLFPLVDKHDRRLAVETFYRTGWIVRRGVNHEKLIEDMPDDVRSEVLLHVYR